MPEALVGLGRGHDLVLLGMSAAAFGIVSLLAWGTWRPTEKLLLHPKARFLGRVSYSYLWHSLLLIGFVRLELALVPPETFVRWDQLIKALTFLATVGLALAVASLSYRWVERPFIALGRRIGRQTRSPAAATEIGAAIEAAAP